MCHSQSLVYRRVHLQHPHLFFQHLHHKIPSLTLADTPTERSGSASEELRGNPVHRSTETDHKNKNEGREEIQSDLLHDLSDWLQELRENLVDERSPLEPRRTPELGYRDTSSSSHELPMESRAKAEPGSGKHSVSHHKVDEQQNKPKKSDHSPKRRESDDKIPVAILKIVSQMGWFSVSSTRFFVCVTVMFRNLADGLCADRVSGAARRRRDRRLRAFLKHERMTMAMNAASVSHHSFKKPDVMHTVVQT